MIVSSVPLEGSVTPISDQELQVVTNNNSDITRNLSVTYAVTSPPKLGRLVQRMHDNSFRNISTFTQSMVRTCAFACASFYEIERPDRKI